MKLLIWAMTGLAAVCWTMMIVIAASLANWLAGSADQAVSGLQTISQWPVPAWAAIWIDPVLLEPIKAMTIWSMNLLVSAGPWQTPLLSWVAPLLWVVWALVMLVLLVLAFGGHFLVGKLRPAISRRPATSARL